MLNVLEAKDFMQLERIFLLNLIKMRTLNDLLSLIRTQNLVYMDDYYFCHCGVLVHQEGAICTIRAQYAPWCTRETMFFEKFRGP